MDLNQIADLVASASTLLPMTGPQWTFASALLVFVAAAMHAYAKAQAEKKLKAATLAVVLPPLPAAEAAAIEDVKKASEAPKAIDTPPASK